MAVVHGIVRNHGGAIKVESAPGRGTCVSIHLPLSEAPAESPDAMPIETTHDPARGQGERILLVDDEPGVAETRGLLLRRLGYEVVVHVQPEDALADFRRRPQSFGLVLTDHMMPGLDGLQLATAMLEVRSDLPILLTSGNALAFADDTIERWRLRGLLPKPCTFEELASAVRQALVSVPT